MIRVTTKMYHIFQQGLRLQVKFEVNPYSDKNKRSYKIISTQQPSVKSVEYSYKFIVPTASRESLIYFKENDCVRDFIDSMARCLWESLMEQEGWKLSDETAKELAVHE